MREVMISIAGHSATALVSSARMRERQAVGPMHVLDDQQSRLFSARSLDDPGEGAPITANSRCVVHRIVQGAQFPGLRNIEEIVEEDELFRLHEILGQRRGGGGARARSASLKDPDPANLGRAHEWHRVPRRRRSPAQAPRGSRSRPPWLRSETPRRGGFSIPASPRM